MLSPENEFINYHLHCVIPTQTQEPLTWELPLRGRGNNPTGIHVDRGLIPGLAQWKGAPALLWLWCRLETAAAIQSLACELPYAGIAGQKKKRSLTWTRISRMIKLWYITKPVFRFGMGRLACSKFTPLWSVPYHFPLPSKFLSGFPLWLSSNKAH